MLSLDSYPSAIRICITSESLRLVNSAKLIRLFLFVEYRPCFSHTEKSFSVLFWSCGALHFATEQSSNSQWKNFSFYCLVRDARISPVPLPCPEFLGCLENFFCPVKSLSFVRCLSSSLLQRYLRVVGMSLWLLPLSLADQFMSKSRCEDFNAFI